MDENLEGTRIRASPPLSEALDTSWSESTNTIFFFKQKMHHCCMFAKKL